MNAEIIAVGSEMLTPEKTDTNSLYLTRELNTLGIEVVQKMITGDDKDRLSSAISAALARSELVIVTGGLGPTEDDLTREATAAAIGSELHFDEPSYEAIRKRFQRLKRKIADNNKRQAYVLHGAEILPNDNGTAPGQWLSRDGRHIILLPGPPKELEPMFQAECLPRLERVVPKQVIRSVCLRIAGMGESDVDQLIAPVYTKYTNPVTTILAAAGDIQVYLRARCDTANEAEDLLAEVTGRIEPLLGDRVYSRNGEPLEAIIGSLLTDQELTVGVSESCTGGLLSQRLTSVSGSSNYFAGGLVTYASEVKTRMLGVHPDLIRIHGAVSEPVGRAMAIGCRNILRADYALSVTGFAGPPGGTEENPIGTIFIGLAGPAGCEVKRFQFMGDRDRVRVLAAQSALDLLRRKLAVT